MKVEFAITHNALNGIFDKGDVVEVRTRDSSVSKSLPVWIAKGKDGKWYTVDFFYSLLGWQGGSFVNLFTQESISKPQSDLEKYDESYDTDSFIVSAISIRL